MKKSKIFTLILGCLIFLSCCKGSGGSGKPDEKPKDTLQITIVDNKTQQPVADIGAALILDGKTIKKQERSDSGGKILFKDVPEGTGYQALITNAKGYKSTASQELDVPGNPDNAVLIDKIGNGEGSGLIAGSFKDKESKTGISGMNVTVSCVTPKYNKNFSTDERGIFRAEGLLAGKYTVVGRKAGYAPFQKSYGLQDAQALTIETQFLDKAGAAANSVGNYLVSLNGSKKVSEIKKNGDSVWSFSSLGSIESATRTVNGDTFLSDGLDAKVVQTSVKGGSFFFTGLKFPVWVDSIDGTSFLVTDNDLSKIAEFTNNKETWHFSNGLNRPRSAVYLNNGNVLISDTGNKRVVEVSRDGKVIWSYTKDLDKPTHAIRFTNGNTLITDAGFSRIIEVDFKGKVIWWYAGPKAPDISIKPKTQSNANALLSVKENLQTTSKKKKSDSDSQKHKTPIKINEYSALDVEAPLEDNGTLLFPRSTIKMTNGNVLIVDTGNNRVIEVSREKIIVNEIKNLPRPVSIEVL